ncbi:hypothetical protein GS4_28_00600 [Gordonia soli NBRC 108243]|uniref:Serine/threonine protein kinase n=1 Tax=Gordonia soli NBRC 108243 TaxID=1223545 RepID=M0QQW2_9ACTN|nr:hypothetical protein GS4_28_00600 [Gordonia soli NBRC 108243]
MAIGTGVLVVVAGVLAALLFIPRSEDTATTAATSVSSAATATTTVTATPTPTTTTTEPPVTQPPLTTPRQYPTIAGADAQGFVDGPRCNVAADPAVVIGQTTRSRVVICRVGAAGGLYYKGVADGGAIEIDFPTSAGDTYYATNGAVTYVVSPRDLLITRGGSVVADEPMIAYWSAGGVR